MDEVYFWLLVMSFYLDVFIEVNLFFCIFGFFYYFEVVLLGRLENLVDMLLY